jgi:hypothetical protein
MKVEGYAECMVGGGSCSCRIWKKTEGGEEERVVVKRSVAKMK